MTSRSIPQSPSSGAGDRWPAHRPAVSHRNPPWGRGWTQTSTCGWSAPPPHPPGAWRCTVPGSARRPPCGPGRGPLELPPGPGGRALAGSGRALNALATARYDDGGDTRAGRLRAGRPHP